MKELNWVHTAVVLMAVSLVFYGLRLIRGTASPSKTLHEFGWGAVLLSLVCLGVSLYIRSLHATYFALSNMYESLLVVCMGIQLAFLVLDRWFDNRAMGVAVSALLLGTLLYDLSLPTEIKPLQPALQSYWRSIHVPVILLSYALFTLAFLSSAIYLIKSYWLDPKPADKPGGGQKNDYGSPQLAMATPAGTAADSALLDTPLAVDMVNEQPNLYDELTYRCVAFGFPLLTVGIILGGLWANEAWGNYWSWDPKESMSLVTLLAYGVYLHLRVNGAHPPRTLAWVSVIGFILMLVTYFGVNLMGIGLHSYGKIG